MNAERFSALIEAYGADARRWPEADREPARAFRLAEPALTARLLAEADMIDALLDASPRPPVSPELRDRVLAAVTTVRARRFSLWSLLPRRLVLASGVGFAAAACAGVIAGQSLTMHLTADARADAILYQASMSALDDSEVLG